MSYWITKSNLSIRGLFNRIAMFTLIVVIMTNAVIFFAARRAVGLADENIARGAGENTAQSIANLIGMLNQSLAGQAEDPRLGTIIAQADSLGIRLEEERLTREVPGAWLVRLLPENIEYPDEKRSPRMGFSDLNIVRNSATERSQPTIHLPNSPDAHLALATHLRNGAGVIHASWPMKVLQSALNERGACGIELRQENVELAYRGDPGCKSSGPAGEAAVAGTTWKIAYWTRADSSANSLWFGMALVGSFLAIGGFAWFLGRQLRESLAQDQGSLVSLVKDMQNGNPFSDYHFKLTEFMHIAAEMAKARPAFRSKMPQKARSEARTQPVLKVVKNSVEEDEAIPIARDLEFRTDSAVAVPVEPAIFRAYDIRGVVGKSLSPAVVQSIGRAIGSEMHARGHNQVAIAHDGRLSGPELCESLAKGLMETGRTVTNLGLAPTPVLYLATRETKSTSGVMITGSHNPADHSGLKIVLGGDTLVGDDIQKLRQRIERNDFVSGSGVMENQDLISNYMDRVLSDVQLGRSLKIVMDCGNGAASVVAPELLHSLGCEVVELFCEVDGHFPNHHPDPGEPENLQALRAKVRETGADLGVAFDGDGDRLGVVDSSGKIIWPDRQMMLFAADVLSREPGADIIYDVKCSRHLPSQIVKNGGRPLMWKSGHALIKAKMKETGALLAGELAGHFFFGERWYGFDDAIYACARMIEILSNTTEASTEIFSRLPDSVSTPEIRLPLAEEGENLAIIKKLRVLADFPDARISEIDGLRVDFMDGWGLVRASNTTPSLSLRFEADSEKALKHIQQQIRDLLLNVKPDLALPF